MKKTLSFEECKKYHHDMWMWLAENPGKQKGNCPIFIDIDDTGVYVKFHCFACLYCLLICDKCPIKWKEKENSRLCCCLGSTHYNKWNAYMKSYYIIHAPWVAGPREEKVNVIKKKLSGLAKLIAEMEWTDHFKDKK